MFVLPFLLKLFIQHVDLFVAVGQFVQVVLDRVVAVCLGGEVSAVFQQSFELIRL